MPSGASTGKREALELRDGDASATAARACCRPCATSSEMIAPEIERHGRREQAAHRPRALLELDGTPNKSALGANAILGVSLAVRARRRRRRRACRSTATSAARRAAAAGAADERDQRRRPRRQRLDIQEFMLVPAGLPTRSPRRCARASRSSTRSRELLRSRSSSPASATRAASRRTCGGNEAALDLLIRGHRARPATARASDVWLALDVAASELWRGRPLPRCPGEGATLDDGRADRVLRAARRPYPLVLDRGRPRARTTGTAGRR